MSRPGVAIAYRWELRKLVAQKRTYLGLGAMAALPLAFTAAVAANGGGMEGALYSQVVESGLATPLVLLLEDLHDADVSLDALQYLLRRLAAAPGWVGPARRPGRSVRPRRPARSGRGRPGASGRPRPGASSAATCPARS